MLDTGPKRLSKVAKELNIATDTIIDFLKVKGIEIDSNPNTKISEEVFVILLQKFQTDKLSKEIVDVQKEEAKKEEKSKIVKVQIEEKEEVLIKSNLIREDSSKEKTDKLIIHAEEIKVSDKKEKQADNQLKVVGKIDLSEKGKKQEKKNEPEIKKPVEIVEELPVEQEITIVEPIFVEPIIPESIIETEPTQSPEPIIESETIIEAVVEEAPIVHEAPIIESEATLEEPIIEEKPIYKEVDEEIEIDPDPLPIDLDIIEEKGLKIVGKIELSQFQHAPKKKSPVASTSDPASMRSKKRKRIVKQEPAVVANIPGVRTPHILKKASKDKLVKKHELKKPEVDEKEIKGQITATLAKLAGKQQSAGELRTKIKKQKKKELKERELSDSSEDQRNVLEVIEFITVNELSNLMDVSVTDVITVCMKSGIMVNINQRLDAETITFVADEFDYDVIFKLESSDEPSLEEPDSPERLLERAPVVTIMGHVDHGKTTLLDYIRKSRVTEKEAGGITQHIGAYEVFLPNGKKITFLDTPGHEAFTSMRARGAKVTDIAVIVVSADDSVMPQTKEAISHAQAAGVPLVFAINKIDKDGANPDRIREQLAEMNLLVEEWGGKYQSQEISAKKGINVELLLEKIMLEAEILDLKTDAKKRAIGTVLEATMDKGKGIVVTVLIQKGNLSVGDPILAGAYFGKVKAMYNELRQRITSVGPSTPVEVIGFDGTPTAGDIFYVTESDFQAKDIATNRKRLLREQGIRAHKHVTLDEIGRRIALGSFKELNVIIKGDMDGSVEALADSLQKLSNEEVQVNVIYKAIGQITESDVLLASASDAVIIGFQVRPSMNARKLAENEQIDIRLYSVIYDAIEELKAAIEGMLKPTEEEKIICNIEVRDVFKITKVGTIAGCMVLDGKITRNTKIRVVREGVVVFTGELESLKRFKDDVKEVSTGYECGLAVHNFNDIKVGDIVEGYTIEQVKRKLL